MLDCRDEREGNVMNWDRWTSLGIEAFFFFCLLGRIMTRHYWNARKEGISSV
jgi:hypothetical protein